MEKDKTFEAVKLKIEKKFITVTQSTSACLLTDNSKFPINRHFKYFSLTSRDIRANLDLQNFAEKVIKTLLETETDIKIFLSILLKLPRS